MHEAVMAELELAKASKSCARLASYLPPLQRGFPLLLSVSLSIQSFYTPHGIQLRVCCPSIIHTPCGLVPLPPLAWPCPASCLQGYVQTWTSEVARRYDRKETLK